MVCRTWQTFLQRPGPEQKTVLKQFSRDGVLSLVQNKAITQKKQAERQRRNVLKKDDSEEKEARAAASKRELIFGQRKKTPVWNPCWVYSVHLDQRMSEVLQA